MAVYICVQGHEIDYDDTPSDAVEFLNNLIVHAKRGATEAELVQLIYSRDNPILGSYPGCGRGTVTNETLQNPIYRIMHDILFRARLKGIGVTAEEVSRPFNVTIIEAAQRTRIAPVAIERTIRMYLIESWKKDGEHYLRPEDVERLAVDSQSPATLQYAGPIGTPLLARIGNKTGVSFRVKCPTALRGVERDGLGGNIGTIPAGWESIAIGYSKEFEDTTVRTLLVIAPDDRENAIEHEGFYVRGRFAVVQKRTADRGGKAWRDFEPK
jgi:hypothetical protein